ncbi:Uncharacterized conserved protein, DUF2141 family [bacterium A37T11]|nr:Uncharacterized conserved protein, DUF2141 family [bacterium A37T11]
MKKLGTRIGAMILLITAFGFKNNQPGYDVNVRVTNIVKTGKVMVGLYNQGEGFGDREKMYKVLITPSNGKKEVTVTFKNLPTGDYAVSLMEDLNDNNKMDMKLKLFPKEPYAFSNNVKPKLSMPSFKDCKFSVPTTKTVEISLINP